MSEELKIIISAVTSDAKKGIQGVNKELSGLQGAAAKGGKAIGGMVKVITGSIAVAIGATVAMVAALNKVSESTKEYRTSMAQLTSAFQANGSSATQAKKTYGELFRFMGETDTAVEASNLLSQLTQDEKELAQWTKTLQGVYATFPDSLPIEGLVESANETARVGKITGNLADALNWAGVSEDEFNAKLAQTSTLEEREALIRETLSGLYDDAAEAYEKNAGAIMAQNEAQNRLNESLARAGSAAQPLQTALTNLSASLMEALAPAIEAIVPYLVMLIDWISKAVGWVTSFIGALTGTNKAAESVKSVGASVGSVAKGTAAVAKGMDTATKAAEKLKRTTAGFDELNVISKPTSGGGSSSGASTPAYTGGTGGMSVGAVDTSGLTDAFGKTSKSAEDFAKKIKEVFNKLKNGIKEYATLFTPTLDAWKNAFSNMSVDFSGISNGLATLKDEVLIPFGGYLLEDFVPSIVNSFSTNLAPVFTDALGFAVTEFVTTFQWACEQFGIITEDILIPALDFVKETTTDTFDIIGEEWRKNGESILTNLSGVFDSVRGIWENLYNNVLKPAWDIIIGALKEIWDEHLAPLVQKIVSFALKVGECVMTIWNNFLAPIVNWIITVLAPLIINAVNMIMQVVKSIVGIISGVLGGVFDALGGLLDFITGVFSGNWKKAWEGIKNFFKGIWDAIWSIVKGIVNLIIDGINLLWSGIYSAVAGIINGIGGIADAIGDLFGQDWSFEMPKKAPLIPKLAKGGIVTSETLATIGERGKEAVLPLENNTGWMDMLADRIASKNSAPSKIVLTIDGRELGWATVNQLSNIYKQTGDLPIAII